jgi:DNA-binding Xre family transcriptional regulator
MNYNELTFLAKEKNITLTSLAKEIGMTPTGFKPAIERKTLPWEKIETLCGILNITPNDLFGWSQESVSGNGNYAANISGGNTQNSNEAILALREELKSQRAIIKEKDKQINRLLAVIEKNKLK